MQMFLRMFKGLKATNGQQDDVAGILHQVAQFPMDLVYLYTRCPCLPYTIFAVVVGVQEFCPVKYMNIWMMIGRKGVVR